VRGLARAYRILWDVETRQMGFPAGLTTEPSPALHACVIGTEAWAATCGRVQIVITGKPLAACRAPCFAVWLLSLLR
jgi:hypothetical protein